MKKVDIKISQIPRTLLEKAYKEIQLNKNIKSKGA